MRLSAPRLDRRLHFVHRRRRRNVLRFQSMHLRLLAGAPCLIPRGRAIDGYFPDGSVVLTADPGDEAAIARGLVRLVREEAAFKARLAELGTSGRLALLTRPAIRDSYLGALAEMLLGHEEA